MRVVDAVAQWFESAGFTHYFGYNGGAIWPMLDALIDHPELEGIQAKHESHAVHMADVYYRTTGRIAPVLVSKGPGLLNAVGGVASAMHDPAAMMVFTGAGSTHVMGKGGMQELYYNGFEDAVSVFRPVTKGSWMLMRPDTVIDVLNHAYKTAITGRPGPVFIQLPFDVQLAPVDGTPEPPTRLGVVQATGGRGGDRAVGRAAARCGAAGDRRGRRVQAVARRGRRDQGPRGGDAGTRRDDAHGEGHLPESHELSLGVVGRSGTDAAAAATRNADVVLALGARFSDNHTAMWRSKLVYDVPRTKIIHVNVDASEIGRNYPAEVGAVADAGVFLADLTAALGASGLRPHGPWLAEVAGWKRTWTEKVREVITTQTSPIHPARLVYETGEAVAEVNGRILVDVGDTIQYAEPYLRVDSPDAWYINSGMAEMGWASSGVLGAVAADPSRPAVVLTGDGAFNMVSGILATAVEYQLPAVWVVLNNHELGIERKGSATAYQRVHPWARFVRKDTGEPYNPDYCLLAEANGARGVRVEKADEFAPALAHAIRSGQPWVIDVAIDTTVPTFFTEGIDRAYPAVWDKSYPQYSSMTLPGQ